MGIRACRCEKPVGMKKLSVSGLSLVWSAILGLPLIGCSIAAGHDSLGRPVLLNERQGCATVDYQKLDAALAAALSKGGEVDARIFEVFVYVEGPLDESEKAALQRLGVRAEGQGRIFTARLSARDIEELSCQPKVKRLELSQRLRPL